MSERSDQLAGLTVKRLDSGYFHVRGFGPCNWAQPPHWPCDEETLRAHAFGEACEDFVQACLIECARLTGDTSEPVEAAADTASRSGGERPLQINPEALRVTQEQRCRRCRQSVSRCQCGMLGADIE